MATQDTVFVTCGISDDIQIVYLMAQLSHESGEGTEMTESLNYTPAALPKRWPHHFTPAQAMAYGRTADHPANQPMIGELAYGGRMGNAPAPSEDAYNFRGRGFIQTTGRKGYQDLAKIIGLDLVNSPELVNEPAHAFACGVAEFVHYPGIARILRDRQPSRRISSHQCRPSCHEPQRRHRRPGPCRPTSAMEAQYGF